MTKNNTNTENKEETIKIQDFPPKILKRNEFGLIEGVNYVFDEQGLIDWRKMVKIEHLVPNKQRTQETDVTKLEDKDLLILLQGTKELANLRGFTDVHYEVITASPQYCCTVCRITWIPNYESQDRITYFESIGDAHYDNTDSFAKNYLAAISENRAFVRCVRNYLRIAVLSKEEVGGKGVVEQNNNSSSNIQVELLQKELDKRKITWPQFQAKLIKDKIEGAENMKNLSELPKDLVFSYIERLKKNIPEKVENNK